MLGMLYSCIFQQLPRVMFLCISSYQLSFLSTERTLVCLLGAVLMSIHIHYMSRHIQTYVVCFLLGNSLAFEFYMPMFRNTMSVPSS